MKKKFSKPLCIVLLIPIMMISWVFYSFVPTSFEPDISYGKELSKLYQSLYLKQFSCFRMRLSEDNEEVQMFFDTKSSSGRRFSLIQYSSDDCIKDIIKIRNETTDYLKKNPDNPLNLKKIKFFFHTYADESMYMYNYDFQNGLKEENAYDFLYFDDLELEDISVLRPLSDAKKIVFSGDEECSVEELAVFDDFNNLKLLDCPKSFSVEMINLLKEKLPNCEIVQ